MNKFLYIFFYKEYKRIKKFLNKKIKPSNFMLIGSEKNGIIPCLPYDKDITGIQYKPFVDYKTDTASDKLNYPYLLMLIGILLTTF